MAIALILASASPTRLGLLQAAGVPVMAEAAGIDEDEIKEALAADQATAEDCAETLAELKAQRIAQRHPGALVIGADQVLDLNGRWMSKPPDLDAARAQLLALRGKRHRLVTAAVAVRDGVRLWHTIEVARLTMRDFSEEFLEDYLVRAGEDLLGSVGAYRLEGLGAGLFDRIDGDFFTILGLPLLPLLRFLRGLGAIRT